MDLSYPLALRQKPLLNQIMLLYSETEMQKIAHFDVKMAP